MNPPLEIKIIASGNVDYDNIKRGQISRYGSVSSGLNQAAAQEQSSYNILIDNPHYVSQVFNREQPAAAGLSNNPNNSNNPKPAILLRGPDQGLGFAFLPPNAIKYYKGRYQITIENSYEKNDGPEIKKYAVDVYYTEQKIVPFSDWNSYDCGPHQLLAVDKVLFYQSMDRWSLFFQFPPEPIFDNDRKCNFIDIFLNRFRYFLGTARGEHDRPPFPAVLH